MVDQTLEKNVDFQGKSGLSPKIRRTAFGETCEWCQAVAGTYSYPNVPKDVYRRHANCDCIVEYIDGGKIQDVHSKIEYQSKAERDAAVQRWVEEYQQRKAAITERTRNNILKLDLQFFAEKPHKRKKVPQSDPLWDSLAQGDVEQQLEDRIFPWEHGGYRYLVEITERYEYNFLDKKKMKNIHEKGDK